MDLSVLVVNFNTKELLINCLRSIIENTRRHSNEIFVVDNGSSDGSADVIREQFSGVTLIANGRNVGFAAANNQALKSSQGRYVVFLNPDTLVQTFTFDTMVDFMDNHPEAGAAGCRLFFPDGRPQNCAGDFPTLRCMVCDLLFINRILDKTFPSCKFTPHHYYPDWMYQELREVPAIGGACLMVRRQTLDQVGSFDEDYFMYHEDIDLCYRIRKRGWKIFFIPVGGVVHYLGQSSCANRREMKVAEYKSRFLFYKKHYSYLALRVFAVICFVSYLIRTGRGIMGLMAGEGIAKQNEIRSHIDIIRLTFLVLAKSAGSLVRRMKEVYG